MHKKMSKKLLRACPCVSAFALVFCFFMVPLKASAAEMYPSAPLRWVVQGYNNYYWTKVNADYLSSYYSGQVDQAVNNWCHNPTRAWCTKESSSNDNVELCTTTSSWWSYNVKYSFIAAITAPMDTNHLSIWNETDAQKSTRRISSANIYFNPANLGMTDTRKLATIVHELGHVYGMGHVSDNSIMVQGSDYTALTSVDISVMDSFY